MRLPVFMCAALLISARLSAQTSLPPATDAERKHQLDQQVPGWLKEFNVSSASIAYIDSGKIALTAYYGDQVPGGPPANEKTLYNVASLTKPITAEVILRMSSEQKLSLDEPLSPFWIDPDIKDNPWTKLLTPRICLSHQTGFTNWRYQTKGVLTFQWETGHEDRLFRRRFRLCCSLCGKENRPTLGSLGAAICWSGSIIDGN
jgi:CubicO group peptidase (beta-lactamase class C family)